MSARRRRQLDSKRSGACHARSVVRTRTTALLESLAHDAWPAAAALRSPATALLFFVRGITRITANGSR